MPSKTTNVRFNNDHFPTSKFDYSLVTPMILDTCDYVAAELEKMEVGICICGKSRYGKSRMIRHLEEKIAEQYPTVTIARANMITRDRYTDTRFFMHLLTSMLPDIEFEGSSDDLRTAIVRHFIVQCANKQDPRVLIILDEAQRLDPRQYSFLIDLTNAMDTESLAPTVLLVGQEELLSVREILLKQKRKDVIGRFFDRPILFEAITTEKTATSILRLYDDFTEAAYPKTSNTCITQAYVGKHFKQGFRLEHAARGFWSAFEKTANDMQMKAVVGMRNFTRVVEAGLTRIAIDGDPNAALDDIWWSDILRDVGFLRDIKTDTK